MPQKQPESRNPIFRLPYPVNKSSLKTIPSFQAASLTSVQSRRKVYNE